MDWTTHDGTTNPARAHIESAVLDELLTVDEVATLLKVPRSWVYEHTRSRGTPPSERLPYIKLGK